MQTIGINTRTGIQLAQQNRKVEALGYLRRAVLNEPVNAEVWLWLAYVSPDAAEYQNCVRQALSLDPYHLTAQRMQHDIDAQGQALPPPIMATQAVQDLSRGHKRGRFLRGLLILVTVIGIFAGCFALTAYAFNTISQDDLENYVPFLSAQSKRIQFAVANDEVAYGFRVDVPDSWYPTDVGSPSWRAERDRLQQEFPNAPREVNLWREFESDFGALVLDESNGSVMQSIAIIETRSSRLEDVLPNVPNMRLVEISTAQAGIDCAGIGSLHREEADVASQLDQFLNSAVLQQADGRCIYYLMYEDRASNGDALRFLRIGVPMRDNLISYWHVSVPEIDYDNLYRDYVDAILESLQFIEPAQISQ